MADCKKCGAPLDRDTGQCPACIAMGQGDAKPEAVGNDAEPVVIKLPIRGADEPQEQRKPTGAPQAAPQARANLAAPAKRAPLTDDEPLAERGTDKRFEQDLDRLAKAGRPSVVLMGLSGAGKSWLLHRFLYEVSLYQHCDPPFVSVPFDNEEGVEIERTTSFDFYTVFSEPAYSLIDTPGEQTRALTLGGISEHWQLLTALSQAKSIIAAIPCDIAVIGPQLRRKIDIDQLYKLDRHALPKSIERSEVERWIHDARKQDEELTAFATGLINAASALSYVRHHKIDYFDRQEFNRRVTLERVLDHRTKPQEFQPIGGPNGLGCPSYFALTKSDRLVAALHGDGEGAGLAPLLTERLKELWKQPETKIMAAVLELRGLADAGRLRLERPADLIKMVNPKLHHRLLTYFPMGRFDFVSAFFGHLGSTKLQYGHYDDYPEHGVNQMREWIREAREVAEKGERKFSPFAAARQLHFFLHGIPIGKSGI